MQTLYDSKYEHDSCGIGFVAHLKGVPSHSLVSNGITLLKNMSHRGAEGCDPDTGDGAGIQVQLPKKFFESVVKDFALPGQYAVGMLFLPLSKEASSAALDQFKELAKEDGFRFLGLRTVPVNLNAVGIQAQESCPEIVQVFLAPEIKADDETFERNLYILRRKSEKKIRNSKKEFKLFYFASLSSKVIIYKGLLLPKQLDHFYVDLTHPEFESATAMVHSRFSTNTFPTWERAQPFRYLSHNGEINTIQGNLNWMRARQGTLESPVFGASMKELFPLLQDDQSDSAYLDNTLEFLVQGGRSLPHSVMMLIPEPWQAHTEMDLDRRGFYEYHAAMMEPWDGPAAVCFSDGRLIGATLDRNGLRPCRYQIHKDDTLVLASEAGALPIATENVVSRGRLKPGQMFLLDTKLGRILSDDEVKSEISKRKPYRAWVSGDRISLEDLPEPQNVFDPSPEKLEQAQIAFGYTEEELERVILPMATDGEEATSSMGNDTPIAALSNEPQLLFKYFRQLFAQVTNPPIDPIRESLVMSLTVSIGPRPNLLKEEPGECRRIRVKQPILTNSDLAKIRAITDSRFKVKTLPLTFQREKGAPEMRRALLLLCRDAAKAARAGARFLILSDRKMSESLAPIPTLLALSAIHHHLIRLSLRSQVGLIVETGEARDVHHFACLIGYGAGAVNPYVVFDSLAFLETQGRLKEGVDAATASAKYIKAVGKGLLKVISKMGISTLQSYCGAQIFECVGLDTRVVNRYFRGTTTRLSGMRLDDLASDVLLRHKKAFFKEKSTDAIEAGGDIHYRVGSEAHFWNPETISKLQHATRTNDPKTFSEYSQAVDLAHKQTLRGQLEFQRPAAKNSISLSEVESAQEIVKRFTTGAMSFGALSQEAHETLAVAMNRVGAKSNSGEGGEEANRFTEDSNGNSRNSAIKQIASARFGVTAHYLVNARELQIKMAQGAKPGEGGQLPGYKVDAMIAKLRHSTPGVTLISPPPHHDIYSIEDLKQLIFDLRNVNPKAAISVKLVSREGIGTVAAGVAKANADKVLVSGDSGGTGASPLSSIKYAGNAWELGLSETHQTLVLNGLRDRVKLETDGQLKNGRDVAIAALLGAEEFGFSTAPLIVQGCILMRKCHLNTCPVGVATQDPVLRSKFTGQAEHVIHYFFFVAEELRKIMAELGIHTVSEMVGQTQYLKQSTDKNEGPRANRLNLSRMLAKSHPSAVVTAAVKKNPPSSIHRESHVGSLDEKLFERALPAFHKKEKVTLTDSIRNLDRSMGAYLSGRLAEIQGAEGLTDDFLKINLTGSAGQSFGAFLAKGITLVLKGEANDYVGKSLSGGKIAISSDLPSTSECAILIGNTCLFGATSGQAYFAGVAGERFAVRNSGAVAVVEGTGDHGCEYMTGGTVLVLGKTGRNFAAGMSGGIAYVYDEDETFQSKCNLAQVQIEACESADLETILNLLKAHVAETGSVKAKEITADFKNSFSKFVRVMPTEYKRVLAALRLEKQ